MGWKEGSQATLPTRLLFLKGTMLSHTNTLYTRDELLQNYWVYVAQTVDRYQEKPFIVTTNGAQTFGQTNRLANAIYAVLQTLPTVRGVGVALFIQDPRIVVAGMMGVLKAGGYFVPLDVNFPEASLKAMIEIAELRIILTTGQFVQKAIALAGSQASVVNLDELAHDQVIAEPEVSYQPDDIVQILFTSGSTGQPKGAIEDYRYLMRAVHLNLAIIETGTDFPMDTNDRHVQLSSFTFSGQHRRVFTGLVNGSSIYYYDLKADGMAGLPGWIRDNRLTVYQSTPTVFRSFAATLKPDEQFPSITKLSIGGEKRFHEDIGLIRQHFPNVQKLRMGFAATETQRVSTAVYPIDQEFSQDLLPSGRVLSDLKVYIWDEDGQELPPGEQGEIVVYGNALARGYINNPELTKARFIQDDKNPGWQYYKTGDLGKLLSDGHLLHLGRVDNMVKIKGVRIELDAIDKHLLTYPGVTLAASRAFEDARGNKRLASYFVPEQGIEIPISDLREHLAERLPRHLLPHYLVRLDEMPLTGNGKLARNRLPLPQMIRPPLANPFEPAKNELETTLLRIWEEQIGISGIGVTDDFFEVGGDSLIGVLLFVRIEEELGKSLPVSVLLTAGTIRQQAALIARGEWNQSPVICINPGEAGRAPVFFIPGRGGYPTRIRHLAKRLDGGTPVYALQDLMSGFNGKSMRRVETVAQLYINEMRKLYPHGPYVLLGESMGGKIAYEMTQQLLASGESVPVLALLDTYNVEKINDDEIFRYPRRSEYYKMLVEKHASIWRESTWGGRMDYLRFYFETGFGKMVKFAKRYFSVDSKQVASALPEQVLKMRRANRHANEEYIPQPYPDKVILFKALRGIMGDITANGWDKVGIKELVIHTLDCYHGSILFEPAVIQLAAHIQTYLDALAATSKSQKGI